MVALALVAAGGCSPPSPSGVVGAPARAATSAVPAVAPVPAVPSTTVPAGTVDLGASWHPGCPVGADELSQVPVTYWGFDDQAHSGSIVVNASVAGAVGDVFGALYEQRFPLRRVEPVTAFGGDDNASMDADNTSGFNCRAAVADGPARWSAHAYGLAIDVNPRENPYLLDGAVLPPAGAVYVDRSDVRPGMAVAGGPLTTAFTAAGWSWGGAWTSPDYQHFSTTGA